MGQSQSTDHPELYEFPPPVQTRGITTPHVLFKADMNY